MEKWDTIKAKHEANSSVSKDFLNKMSDLEHHILYNRKPLKQFRDVHTKYYNTHNGEEVFTETHAKGVIVPPGNPFYGGFPSYLKYPNND